MNAECRRWNKIVDEALRGNNTSIIKVVFARINGCRSVAESDVIRILPVIKANSELSILTCFLQAQYQKGPTSKRAADTLEIALSCGHKTAVYLFSTLAANCGKRGFRPNALRMALNYVEDFMSASGSVAHKSAKQPQFA